MNLDSHDSQQRTPLRLNVKVFISYILIMALSACTNYVQAENSKQFILGKFISSDLYKKSDVYYNLGVYEEYTYTDFHKDENGIVLLKLGATTKRRFFLSMQTELQFIKGNEDIADAREFWAEYKYIYAIGYSTDLKHPSTSSDEIMLFETTDIFPLEITREGNKGIWLKTKLDVN